MKPIRLVMEAFGSYGKQTSVDFRKPNQNLFLISGDTGAGKSTIFDAIVFALYGEASSSETKKEGEVLRSQYAALCVEPFVKLEFSEGEDIYTVKRIPGYRKLRTRGAESGTLKETPETEKVSLTMPDGQEYIGSLKETNGKIEEIVGLTKAQFMQVAMIAQGEFMKILREESKQKKEIFRKLFHTELFEKIVRELERRKTEKGKALEGVKTECRTIAANVTIPEEYESAESLNALKSQIMGGTLANMEQFMAGLEALCKHLSQEQSQIAEGYHQAEEKRDKTKEAYTRAEGIVKYFAQLENAEKILEECERAGDEIKEKEALIRDIRAAYEILGLFARYEEAQKKAKETDANIKAKKELLPVLTAAAHEADEIEKRTKKELDAEQGSLHRIKERVEEAKKTFEKIKAAQENLKKSKSALNKAGKAEEKEQKALRDLKEKETAWKERAAGLGNAEAAYEAWKGKNMEAERLEKEVCDLKKIKSDLARCDAKMHEAQAKFEAAERAYEQKNDEYQTLNKRYMASRAKYFVDRLEEGKPCPICGAIEHPSPYRIEADVEDISKELLEEMKKEAEALNKKQSAAAQKSGAAVTAFEEKEKAFLVSFEKLHESMLKHIGIVAKEMTDETVEELFKRWKNTVTKEGEELDKNVKELHDLERALSNAETEKDKLGEAIEASHKAVEAANTAVKSSEREIESLKEGGSYASEEEAIKELQTAEEQYALKKKEYDKAAANASKAAADKTKTETSISQYEQELPVQIADAAKKKEAYETMMRDKDLAASEWKALVEKHHKNEPEQLQKEVQDYGKKKASAESLKNAAQKEVAGKERPDLESLEKECRKAQEAYRAALENFDTIKERYKENQKVYEKLKPRNQECAAAASEYHKLERLYKLFSGNVSGGRMDLETYVQRYYLEQILYAANRRFREMSAGQFELRMIDLDKAGEGRSNKGLDLMVYSTVTGKTREIRTLSGGESFMAALALSLGMADQIQQSAAALNLDMMFIDEGFGSLDEHSRSQAVKVLKEMAGGSRLVGIISHVTELKQEIDNQLLVRRDENGSYIEWKVS